jgi:hypothetical protein
MPKNIFRPPPTYIPHYKPATIKRITCLIAIFWGIILVISSCDKEDSRNRMLLSLQVGCSPEVFSVPGNYIDSIYYSFNKISQVNKYFPNYVERNTKARFEYSENEVKIFVTDFYWGSWRDIIYYTLTFESGKISQVETNSGRVKANYFYENDNLNYVLYSKGGKVTDSIAVQWELKGNNISRASWFQFDETIKMYQLTDAVNYSFDDKNNPYKNSLHFLYNFYDCEEFSLDYFNMNNPKTIKSLDYELHKGYIYNYNLHTEYSYNENNYPTSVIFYDLLNQISDRNTISYNCK